MRQSVRQKRREEGIQIGDLQQVKNSISHKNCRMLNLRYDKLPIPTTSVSEGDSCYKHCYRMIFRQSSLHALSRRVVPNTTIAVRWSGPDDDGLRCYDTWIGIVKARGKGTSSALVRYRDHCDEDLPFPPKHPNQIHSVALGVCSTDRQQREAKERLRVIYNKVKWRAPSKHGPVDAGGVIIGIVSRPSRCGVFDYVVRPNPSTVGILGSAQVTISSSAAKICPSTKESCSAPLSKYHEQHTRASNATGRSVRNLVEDAPQSSHASYPEPCVQNSVRCPAPPSQADIVRKCPGVDEQVTAAEEECKRLKLIRRKRIKAQRRRCNQKLTRRIAKSNQAIDEISAALKACLVRADLATTDEYPNEGRMEQPRINASLSVKVSASTGLIVATLNVRTLNLTKGMLDAKLEVLAAYCERHGVDIMALQETRTHDDMSFTLPGGKFHFISAKGREDGNYGVGVLLSARAAMSLKSYRTVIEHRVLELIIGDVTVTVVYAPCCGDAKRTEEREEFYQQLRQKTFTECCQKLDNTAATTGEPCPDTRNTEADVLPLSARGDQEGVPATTVRLPAKTPPLQSRSNAAPCPGAPCHDDNDNDALTTEELEATLRNLPTSRSGQRADSPPKCQGTKAPTCTRETRDSPISKCTKFRLLLGDFNADLSRRDAAAEELEDFLDSVNYLAIAQSLNSWSPTWKGGDGKSTRVLDYIILPKRFASAVTKMYVDESPIESDHLVVRALVRVHWREEAKRKKKEERKPLRDYAPLACCPEERAIFDAEVRIAMNAIAKQREPGKLVNDDRLMELRKALDQAAEAVLKEKTAPPKMMSNTPKLLPMLEELEKKRDDIQLKKGLLKEAQSVAAAQATKMVDEYVKTVVNKRDPWHAWQHIFAMRKEGLKRSAEGLTSEKLEKHFTKLLRKGEGGKDPPDGFELPARPWGNRETPVIDMSPFTVEEIRRAAQSQSNHKANGPDGVDVEALKCPTVQEALVPIFNEAMKDADQIPKQFFDAFLIALHKKGDVEDPNNYRGISLMSHVAKLFHLVLMKRIRAGLDQYISPTQNAYRPSRSCHQHTVAATALYHAAQNHPGYKLHMLFVDFSKAFDSIDRVSMERILRWWNIPAPMVKVIMRMLSDHKLFIRHLGEVSSTPVQPTTGILQGDTLAPLIFILCMDYILLQLKPEWGAEIEQALEERPGREYFKPRGRMRLSNLAYADDVVLLANSFEHIQKQFDLFQKLAKSIGMSINLGAGKTEEIRVNVPADPHVQTLDGKAVSQVTTYKYLGTTLGLSWEADFKRRKKLAWGVIAEFSRVWRSDASFDARKGLFVALVEPILLYGAFTYPNKQVVDDTLHRCHARMLRHCVGLGRPDPRKLTHKPTEYLYYGKDDDRGKTWRSATLTLPAAIARQKLAALGHWTRDHFSRGRKHPVIDVLIFDPSTGYARSQTAQRSVRDAFESLVPQRQGHGRLTLRQNVLTNEYSMTADKHSWYDESKRHVHGIERSVMRRIFDRRKADPQRNFDEQRYNDEMEKVNNRNNFTIRWLTTKTRQEPLGEDRVHYI